MHFTSARLPKSLAELVPDLVSALGSDIERPSNARLDSCVDAEKAVCPSQTGPQTIRGDHDAEFALRHFSGFAQFLLIYSC